MDEKYWKDYVLFIKLSEKVTGRNPAKLLERYKILHLNQLKDNLLKQHFENEIVLLDERMKPFLSEHAQ